MWCGGEGAHWDVQPCKSISGTDYVRLQFSQTTTKDFRWRRDILYVEFGLQLSIAALVNTIGKLLGCVRSGYPGLFHTSFLQRSSFPAKLVTRPMDMTHLLHSWLINFKPKHKTTPPALACRRALVYPFGLVSFSPLSTNLGRTSQRN